MLELTRLQAEVLSLMGWIDGEFDEVEQLAFFEILQSSPGSDKELEALHCLVAAPPVEESVISNLQDAPREIAFSILKLAYLLAFANDHLHDEERALLARLGKSVGVTNTEQPRFFEMLEKYKESWEIERTFYAGGE